jgi:transposase-like protein
MKRRKIYSSKEKMDFVKSIREGGDIDDIGENNGIPVRNLRRWINEDKKWREVGNGEPYSLGKRRGPEPALPREAETNIHEWVVGQQVDGAPVGRKDIIRKAQQISKLVNDQPVGEGWYRRFKDRFPELSSRTSQTVAKVRNNVTELEVAALFGSLANVIVEENMDGSRVFNVDETAFESSRKTTRVVVLKGSKNVWHTDPTTSFHLSIVACGRAKVKCQFKSMTEG